jgi:transposase
MTSHLLVLRRHLLPPHNRIAVFKKVVKQRPLDIDIKRLGGREEKRQGVGSVTITVLLRTIERVTQTKCLTCECEIILSVFYHPNVDFH